jgi:HD superfamily phosphodiesterase
VLPTRAEAERLVEMGSLKNPGPWADHCRMVGRCAERIAARCSGMVPEKAYILGLLHDIGRQEGATDMAHVIDGYRYLQSMGYEEAARICITHSFSERNIETYIGRRDVSPEDYAFIKNEISSLSYDDYDRLIQLCDSLAMADGTIDLKTRMDDIERRHGGYPASKREAHCRLKAYFDHEAGFDLYTVLRDGAMKFMNR